MSVPIQVPVSTHTGNGVTVNFAYQYLLLNALDILVMVEDRSAQVLNVDYTISGLGVEAGGTVTFAVPPESGKKIILKRAVRLQRDTKYQYQGDFESPVVNADYDRIWMAIQDSAYDSSLAIVAPVGDTAPSLVLPDAVDRALKFLAFDSSGSPIAAAGVVGVPVSAFMAGLLDDPDSPTALATLGAVPSINPSFSGTAYFGAGSTLVFEGSSDDASEGTIDPGNPTADRTWTFPDKSGEVCTVGQINNFRLTLTSGTPITTADVTGSTTIYCTPFGGNRIALYVSGRWVERTSAEFSRVLGTLVSARPYDVFCYDNSGVPALEFLAWTNDLTRATALVMLDGVLVKAGDSTRRYLGSFYTTSTTTTEDSIGNRYLFNYYNRAQRPCRQTTLEATATWTYTTLTWRQANANANNQLNMLIGWADTLVDVQVKAHAANGGAYGLSSGIGIDSTTVNSAQLYGGLPSAAGSCVDASSYYRGYPAVGKHTFNWLEISEAASTTTWNGRSAAGVYQLGIRGVLSS